MTGSGQIWYNQLKWTILLENAPNLAALCVGIRSSPRAVCDLKAMTTHAAVILAAGKGTRMNSRIPKVLHRVCGIEMVCLVEEAARQAGLAPIAVVVPHESQQIETAIGPGVCYVTQTEQLGTGHAVLQAEGQVEAADNILVMYGDVPLVNAETLKRMMRLHDDTEACITLLTSTLVNPEGLGRIVRDRSGAIKAIVEEEYADDDTRSIREINSGFYCFRAQWLWKHLNGISPSQKGEVFLTDLVALAVQQGMTVESVLSADAYETIGVNNRIQLAEAEAVMRQRIRERWMINGVSMPDPSSVYIDHTVELGEDTVILPNSHITGQSHIGEACKIGPNSVISDSILGKGCEVISSVIRDSHLEDNVDVGPFSHIRGGSHLEQGVHVGTSAEVKSSRLGRDTKMGHFSYMGDAHLGTNVNIGAGAITCNFDGEKKNKTRIGDDVFISCDTMLIAPIKLGDRSATGAGAVVTKDVAPDSLVVGMPARKVPRKPKSDP